MALCDSDRCAWSSSNLVEAAASAGGPAAPLNGIISNGSRNTQPQPAGDGVKLRKEDCCVGTVKSSSTTTSEAKKSSINGSAVTLPLRGGPKPPSCILGIGTATPDRVFHMSEFAKAILHGYGPDTPEVREFSARICKIDHPHLPSNSSLRTQSSLAADSNFTCCISKVIITLVSFAIHC